MYFTQWGCFRSRDYPLGLGESPAGLEDFCLMVGHGLDESLVGYVTQRRSLSVIAKPSRVDVGREIIVPDGVILSSSVISAASPKS